MIDPVDIEKRDRIIDEIHKAIKMCIPEDQDAPWAVDGQIEKISDMSLQDYMKENILMLKMILYLL